MKKNYPFIAILTLAPLFPMAQTLYVPGGTGGIGTSQNSNVGIGVSTPVNTLDVNGVARFRRAGSETAGATLGGDALSLQGWGPFNPYIQWVNSNGNRQGYMGWNTDRLSLVLENGYNFTVETGNVGIGTSTPTTALDVNGTIRSTTYLKVTNVAYGHGLFADDGVGSTVFSLTRQLNNETRLHSFGYHTFYSGGSSGTEKMRIDGNGNIGINNSNPAEKLHIDGTVGIGKFSNASYAGLKIEYTDGGSGTTVFKHQRWGGDFYFKREGSTGERTQLYFGGSSSHRMDIYDGNNEVAVRFQTNGNSYFNGGNVGIGTTSPDSKLSVNGTIHTKEVKVDLTGWSDFVFEPDYKLQPLSEIAEYIKSNKHLPGVPSEKEVEANGVHLGEMNKILLQKIEELTLHVIELKNENDRQNKIIQELTANKK